MSDLQFSLQGIVSGPALDKHYRSVSRKYVYKKGTVDDIEKFSQQGWELFGPKNRKTRSFRKKKEIGIDFQDEVWCIFHKMGFTEMNGTREFFIPRFGLEIGKKIDVFAKDEHCICLVECKAAEQPHTKRSLGPEIDQYGAIHQEIERAIKLSYSNKGDDTKYRFRWLLVLKNVDLNENDEVRANNANMMIIDDSLISYYAELAKHFGPASRYQFFADLYPGMTIPELIEPVPAIRGKLGNETFYSFVIEPEKLLKIAYISHRGKSNESSLKTYQRMANRKRLSTIAKYITEKNGIFPTNIVLNIETGSKGIKFEQGAEMAGRNAVAGTLYLPNVLKTAWLIDGQHRLFAYSGLPEAKTATLPVIAFEDLDASVQQQLFIDINGEQVRVSKNLLNDLYDDLHWNSEQPKNRLLALTSKIVKNLNENGKSPLRDRVIKIGGRRTATRNLTLTALTEEIRRTKILGYVHSQKAKDITPGPFYQNDLDSSLKRATEVLIGFYGLFVKNETVRSQWEAGSNEGGYICTNQGILASLRVLKAILDHLQQKKEVDIRNRSLEKLIADIEEYLNPVIDYLANASPAVIKQYRKNYAEAGVQASTFALLKVIKQKHPDFDPAGLSEHLAKTDTSNNQETWKCCVDIETMIHENVIAGLKKVFGEGRENWWYKGVKEKIRMNASALADKCGDYAGPEKYVYLIELKEIIEDNWDFFAPTYTIDAKQTDSRAKKLAWCNELNRIRNIVDHPPRGGVTVDELNYVKKIKELLAERISPENSILGN